MSTTTVPTYTACMWPCPYIRTYVRRDVRAYLSEKKHGFQYGTPNLLVFSSRVPCIRGTAPVGQREEEGKLRINNWWPTYGESRTSGNGAWFPSLHQCWYTINQIGNCQLILQNTTTNQISPPHVMTVYWLLSRACTYVHIYHDQHLMCASTCVAYTHFFSTWLTSLKFECTVLTAPN